MPRPAPDNRAAAARLVELGRNGSFDELFERFEVRLATVFGSSVRGHPQALGGAAAADPGAPPRDVDIAVAFSSESGDLVGLLDALASEIGPAEVDGLDLDRAGIVAEAEAVTTCVPLYEVERGLYAERQVRAVVRRLDTAWLRRLDLEVLAEGR